MTKKRKDTFESFLEYFEGKLYICELTHNKIGSEIYQDVIKTLNLYKEARASEIELYKVYGKQELLEELKNNSVKEMEC
jgi:hypothetical protein